MPLFHAAATPPACCYSRHDASRCHDAADMLLEVTMIATRFTLILRRRRGARTATACIRGHVDAIMLAATPAPPTAVISALFIDAATRFSARCHVTALLSLIELFTRYFCRYAV